MRLLCFLAAAGFWPWFISPSSDAKLFVLSIGIPLAFYVYRPRAAWLPWAFLLWCSLTILWGPLWDGLERLWYFTLLVLAFHLGTVIKIRLCFFWWCAGVGISSLLTIPQSLGWDWIEQAQGPAGLMMNKNYVAEASAMALVAGPWLLALPGLLIPMAYGPFLGLWLVIAYRWKILGSVLLIAGAVFLAFALPDRATTPVRTAYWANSVAAFLDKPWGHGAGSYWSVYPFYHDSFMNTPSDVGYSDERRPRTAHNDFLTLLVETGIPGIAILGVLIWRCLRGRNEAKWLFLVFLGCGFTAFPLFVPSTGFIAALAAGSLYRDWECQRLRSGPERDLLSSREIPAPRGIHVVNENG